MLYAPPPLDGPESHTVTITVVVVITNFSTCERSWLDPEPPSKRVGTRIGGGRMRHIEIRSRRTRRCEWWKGQCESRCVQNRGHEKINIWCTEKQGHHLTVSRALHTRSHTQLHIRPGTFAACPSTYKKFFFSFHFGSERRCRPLRNWQRISHKNRPKSCKLRSLDPKLHLSRGLDGKLAKFMWINGVTQHLPWRSWWRWWCPQYPTKRPCCRGFSNQFPL